MSLIVIKSKVRPNTKISEFLRHSAVKRGYKITPSGGINLKEFMKLFSMSFEEIDNYIKKDTKERYRFLDKDDNVIPLTIKEYKEIPMYIKACQGHSILQILDSPIIKVAYDICAHSTDIISWKKILEFGGMSKMSRSHIHFAKGDFNSNEVISGMRRNRPVKIFINMKKAMDNEIVFNESDNGVILTSMDVPCIYFKEVYVNDILVFQNGQSI